MTISIVTDADYFDFAALVGPYVKKSRNSARDLLTLTNSIVDKTNDVVAREVDDALDVAESPFRRIMDEQTQQLRDAEAISMAQQRDIKYYKDNLHNVLTHIASTDPIIIEMVNKGENYNAIKRLRNITNVTLKPAADAIKSDVVKQAAAFVVVGQTTV